MAHRIILLNFTEKQAHQIAKAGFNVERGYIGKYHKTQNTCAFYSPHPLYEYDILFYNSHLIPSIENDFPSTINLLAERGSMEALLSFEYPPSMRVSFIGEPSGIDFLLQGGVSFVDLVAADTNVSSFVECEPSTFSSKELHQVLAGLKNQVTKVGQFFKTRREHYPFYTFAVLRSRSGDAVAGYGTTYNSKVFPHYIVLPQLKDISHAAIEILQVLETVTPQLFPDKIKRDWLHTDEFLLPEEKEIKATIEQKIAEATAFIQGKKKELESIAAQNSFVRELLVATEDSKLAIEHRLSGVVKRALEFLEFEVIDIDEKTKSAIKKEDFWVIDGDFLAITEVTGTIHKNPKIKEYNDILGRVTTIYKRKGDLALPTDKSVNALLVLNYDIDNHPSKRPRVYTGDDQHIVEAAFEQGIGLLSTAELHKIVLAVKENFISKNQARMILRKSGRIEFDLRVLNQI